VPNDEVEWVREAFQRYSEGEGAGLIGRWLNDESVKPPNGGSWNRQKVLRMLGSSTYLGLVRWNGIEYDGKHPAIVDPKLWGEVQKRREVGQRGKCRKARKGGGGYQPALLGRLRDESGAPFARYWVTNRHGARFVYYVCPQTGRRVSASKLDAAFARLLREFMTSPGMFAVTLDESRQLNAGRAKRLDARLKRLRHDVDALAKKEERLIDAVAEGLPADAATSKLEDIRSRRAALQARLDECEQQREGLDRQAETADRFARLQEFFAAIRDGDEFLDIAEMLRATVHHVTLSVKRKRAWIALNLTGGQAVSNPEDAGNEAFSQLSGSSESISPDMTNPGEAGVSLRHAGEGDGTRTHNHQIDSLVL
ncbi:recombinase family protein, partial [Planctomycetota bacterium]